MSESTRRELLQALLGVPAAALLGGGCGAFRRAPTLAFEGAIVGGPDAAGHKLRDGFRPLPSAVSRRRVGVLVVGGGVAGLSAAWRLERAGQRDYQVLELDDAPGGTARGGQNAVSRFPWGAHYLPCPLPHARAALALLEEMGVCSRGADGGVEFDEAQLCRAPQERLFLGDRFYEGLAPAAGQSPEDRRQFGVFGDEVNRWAAARDGRGRRAFAVPMAAGSDDAHVAALDRLSMADWLAERRLDSRRLRWFVEYATRDDFGARLEDVSAWAGLHYFAARNEDGRGAEFLTWPEGNARLVDHLARAAGPRLSTSALALEVTPLPRGAEVLVHHLRTGASERITAEHVVVAAPRAHAARLVAPWRTSPPAHVAAFQCGSWLVANLTLDAEPASRGFPLCWDNVLSGSSSLGYVVATHQLDPGGCAPAPGDPCSRRAPPPRGPSVWTWYLPMTDRDPAEGRRKLAALTWRQAADLVVSDLARAHPDIAARIRRLDVWRWGHAMVRPHPGFVFSAARAAAAAPLGDIHFAHSDLSGLPLFEEAQYHGVRAAEAILAARGVRFESLL